MEPVRLRALLARTPGLVARHLTAASEGTGLPADLLRRLLAQPLRSRARCWLQHPDNRLIDSDLRWIKANEAQIITCLDPEYPSALTQLDPAPATLYARGKVRALATPALAMVGSRQATASGINTAHRFAGELARAGLCVISGLADGIDTAAHQGALAQNGQTIAVCATGLDRIYPAHNAGLAAQICGNGCLISVFAPGTPPRRHHFPLRNRLIGALGAGTVVVEAAAGSGSLLTAGQARRLRRLVFAVPGSIRDPNACGCNQLIRAGAILVQHSREILQELNLHNIQYIAVTPRPAQESGAACSPLDNKYEMLLDAAGFEPVDIDTLAFRTGWCGHTVASMLLLLELRGRVAPQPGGRYCRLS
ncbi:MAG TPA: DNA-processing protein DprA [Steroidobacteraceae bacterium]|jgi:DNA processing protein